MAFIGTLRDKAGTWAAVFVFVAIAAFTLGDIFSGKSSILNWGRNSIGEIGGKEISYEEFQKIVNETEGTYRMQTGREPGEREMAGIRQQAWDLLIARYAIAPEFKKVGSEVTDDEVIDMINGENIDPGIRQSFTDPKTQQFDRSRLNAYLQQVRQAPITDQGRAQWEAYQANLKPARERIKYENLLLKSTYVTSAEAERAYHAQNDVAEIKFLYVPFFVVSDSAAQVTDADLQDYYNKHKEQFKTEASRDLMLASIPVVPSRQDSAVAHDDLSKALTELKASTSPAQDSTIGAEFTDAQSAYQKFSVANLPPYINKDSLVVGKVYGPITDGESERVIKVSAITSDTIYVAHASHILIQWADSSAAGKAVAKEQAQKILKELKGGANFADQARAFSKDPGSAQNGGDLGWFANNGSMVKPFESAVFGATKPGVIDNIVETQYGYHIIKIDDVKTNKAYNLVVVERAIVPSDATINEAFRKAENLMTDVDGVQGFENKAKELGLTVSEAKGITAGSRFINPIGEARQVIQWLFREAKVGKVSQVFEMEGQNVVAIMTGETDKGYRSLDMVKAEITPEVQKIVKGRQIIEKLKGLHGTLDELAKSFGNSANVYSASDLHLSSPALPQTVGVDPVAVGAAFSLENGKRSNPIAGENGVVVIEMINKTVAPTLTDYSSYKSQLQQSGSGMASFNITEAIKEKAGIEDQRYKFF